MVSVRRTRHGRLPHDRSRVAFRSARAVQSGTDALGLQTLWLTEENGGGALQEGVLVLDTDAQAYAHTATHFVGDEVSRSQRIYSGQTRRSARSAPPFRSRRRMRSCTRGSACSRSDAKCASVSESPQQVRSSAVLRTHQLDAVIKTREGPPSRLSIRGGRKATFQSEILSFVAARNVAPGAASIASDGGRHGPCATTSPWTDLVPSWPSHRAPHPQVSFSCRGSA
jgi:hypothetical protein